MAATRKEEEDHGFTAGVHQRQAQGQDHFEGDLDNVFEEGNFRSVLSTEAPGRGEVQRSGTDGRALAAALADHPRVGRSGHRDA